jgi:hypothetical protein
MLGEATYLVPSPSPAGERTTEHRALRDEPRERSGPLHLEAECRQHPRAAWPPVSGAQTAHLLLKNLFILLLLLSRHRCVQWGSVACRQAGRTKAASDDDVG